MAAVVQGMALCQDKACCVHSSLSPCTPRANSSSPTALERRSFWNTRCSCLWSCLDDDFMVLNVFSFFSTPELATLRTVCSRWNSLCDDGVLHESVNLSSSVVPNTSLNASVAAVPRVDTALEQILMRHGPSSVHSLRLCGRHPDSLDPDVVSRGLRRAPLITDLHLCDARVDEQLMQSVGGLQFLQSLHLSRCRSLTDEMLELVAKSRLKSIVLSHCRKLSSACVKHLPSSLVSLDVSRTKLRGSCFAELSRRCPNLEELRARGLRVADADVEELCSLRRLRVLDISSSSPFGPLSEGLSSHSLRALSALAGLQRLSLQGTAREGQLTVESVRALVDGCSSLRFLNLGGCQDVARPALLECVSRCSSLQELQLAAVSGLRSISPLASMTQLRVLDVSGAKQLTVAEQDVSRFPVLHWLDVRGVLDAPRDAVNKQGTRVQLVS